MFSTERTQAKPQHEKNVMNKVLDRGWKEEARKHFKWAVQGVPVETAL